MSIDTHSTRRSTIHPESIEVDRGYWLAVAGDRELELTLTEFQLLAFLIEHPYVVFDRETLVRHVWHEDPGLGSRKVDVHVARLRRKLGRGAGRQIETLRGVGYRYRPATHQVDRAQVPA